MLDRLLKLEEQLARFEALLLVIFVLLMLSLATYNVFYRNVLVPMQVSMLTEDAPADVAPETTPAAADDPVEPTAGDDESGGFGGGFEDADDSAGGFGGGFDDADDSAGGFGGGFGDDEPAAEQPPKAAPDDAAGFGGGFGGDFGDDAAQIPEEAAVEEPPAEEAAEGFGGDFQGDDDESGFGGDFDSDDAAPAETPPATTAEVDINDFGAPKEQPFFVELVDAVKLEWIDVLLRQLVLIVGFLGAMLATRRRKHITVDALSKVLPEKVLGWMAVFTSALSMVVCLVLARAGQDLVNISLEYPKELVSWADEWQFQMAFPIGFGLLALHFGIRVIESACYASGIVEAPDDYQPTGGAL